jgi:UPF0755 protein
VVRFIKILLLLLGITTSLVAFYAYRYFFMPLDIYEEGYYFEFEKGSSLGHLSLKLNDDQVISNRLFFKIYARVFGLETKLHAGEYHVQAGENLVSLFSQLEKGSTLQRSITFVEGWTYKELFAALKEDQSISWKLDEATIKNKLNLQDQHLEGQFFADTYFYSKGEFSLKLLNTAHDKLVRILEEEWRDREDGLPFKNSYEALILASIVERETGLASERPLIAGVFINRLRMGMRLQTDPTVIYGLGDAYKGNITRNHLKEYTPYNTYRIPALPPTPIAIVGRESIHAALNPKPSKYLYFVAKGDGSHYFSPTLKEHQKAVEQYQWKRVGDYRSAPSQQK